MTKTQRRDKYQLNQTCLKANLWGPWEAHADCPKQPDNIVFKRNVSSTATPVYVFIWCLCCWAVTNTSRLTCCNLLAPMCFREGPQSLSFRSTTQPPHAPCDKDITNKLCMNSLRILRNWKIKQTRTTNNITHAIWHNTVNIYNILQSRALKTTYGLVTNTGQSIHNRKI